MQLDTGSMNVGHALCHVNKTKGKETSYLSLGLRV